jgi:hypothetical protein
MCGPPFAGKDFLGVMAAVTSTVMTLESFAIAENAGDRARQASAKTLSKIDRLRRQDQSRAQANQ